MGELLYGESRPCAEPMAFFGGRLLRRVARQPSALFHQYGYLFLRLAGDKDFGHDTPYLLTVARLAISRVRHAVPASSTRGGRVIVK